MASTLTTPGRKTVATIDVPAYGLMQPMYAMDWQFEKISPGAKNFAEHVHFIPGVGWQISNHLVDRSARHERAIGDGAVLTPSNGNFTVAGGFLEVNQQRWASELTGVPQGDQRTNGDIYLRKTVPAGDSFDVDLSADAAAFPPADAANDIVPLDRVGVGTANHKPTEIISIAFHGGSSAGHRTLQRVLRLCFSGIPGEDADDFNAGVHGLGQYALTDNGDGWAELSEKLTDGTWKHRFDFQFSDATKVVGGAHSIIITSDAVYDEASHQYRGNRIVFLIAGSVGESLSSPSALSNVGWGKATITYTIPQKERNQPTLAPVRLDVRRDFFALVSIAKAYHYESGTLRTNTISLPFVPSEPSGSTAPFYLYWFGDQPTGTTVDVAMYDAKTNAALSDGGGGTASNQGSGFKTFAISPQQTDYYAVITLTTTDPYLTPTINRIRIYRNPQYKLGTPTPVVLSKVEAVSIMGQDSDPSHESFGLTVHDLPSSLSVLWLRAGIPTRVEVQYDPDDATKTSTLTQGYLTQARRNRRGASRNVGFAQAGAAQVYPASDWATYTLRFTGEWQRLMEQQSPKTIDFSLDGSSSLSEPLPWKITDIIRVMLLGAGYPEHMIDVPDLSIRLFNDGNTPALLEMFSEVGPFIIDLCRNYLGGYLIFDANASNGDTGKFGCWRVKIPPRPDSGGNLKNLASFVYAPNSGAHASGVSPASYTDGSGAGGQVIKNTFVTKGSMHDWVIPPEANCIIVTGSGIGGGGTLVRYSGEAQQMTQRMNNYVSAWFMDDQPVAPDPTHPDYLGRVVPLFYADPGLLSENAVNFTCRRLYDMCTHSQKRVSFEAPAVFVTDVEDTKQLRPRLLRFGDPVLFSGQQFVVASCNLDYSFRKGGDRKQHAFYEVFSVPYLQNYAYGAGRT